MLWIRNSLLTSFQKLCLSVIKCGPIPKHVAIIMDGNRRYARHMKVDRLQGHVRGIVKLSETLQWCTEFGIKEITVYMFSIENFKRSQEEVDALMRLAAEKFNLILADKEMIRSKGIRIRIIGNMSLLSSELRKLIAEVVLSTRDNKGIILNIAFAYTSTDEISSAVKSIVEGVDKGIIEVDDINENLISNCLYTNLSFDVDILIRTSGELRLSDFLLWQVSKCSSYIYFEKKFWPQLSIWDLLACIFKYQSNADDFATEKDQQEIIRNRRVESFLKVLEQQRNEEILSYL